MSTERSTCWSVTINNPTAADEEAIALARQKGWKVDGQKERGLLGTEHYQLMVRTPQVRFSALKKQFPRAHIEVARNAAALGIYVNKEDTRVGQLPASQDRYPSLSRFWQLIYDELSVLHGGPAEEDIEWDIITERERLALFDEAVFNLIYKGYYVETIAVNPQTRTSFAKFARAIMVRAFVDSRQTDSAEDTEEVNVPTLTNADDSPPPHNPPSPPSDGPTP